MKEATLSLERRKRVRIFEIATVCAVLGIFASLAIPSFLQMQARDRIQGLLESARSCRNELPGWVTDSVSNLRSESGAAGATDAEALNVDARDILENYACIYNARFQRGARAGEQPPLVVEPTGTPPAGCRRDGRIHLIPSVDPAGQGIGARLVVTDESRMGGPNYDGILAVYEVGAGRD